MSLAKAEGQLEIMEQRPWVISHHFTEYHIMGTLEHRFILSFLQRDTSAVLQCGDSALAIEVSGVPSVSGLLHPVKIGVPSCPLQIKFQCDSRLL